MQPITADTIKDLADTRIKYGARHFYIWLILRYGYKQTFTIRDVQREYPRTRRSLFRYLSELKDNKMIITRGKNGSTRHQLC